MTNHRLILPNGDIKQPAYFVDHDAPSNSVRVVHTATGSFVALMGDGTFRSTDAHGNGIESLVGGGIAFGTRTGARVVMDSSGNIILLPGEQGEIIFAKPPKLANIQHVRTPTAEGMPHAPQG